MRIYEKRTYTHTSEVLVLRKCDLCGKQAKGEDWEGAIYQVKETEVSVTVHYRDGSSYPDGGSGLTYSVDLCPGCFKDRLLAWLAQQGARIEPLEWSF